MKKKKRNYPCPNAQRNLVFIRLACEIKFLGELKKDYIKSIWSL